MASVLNSSQKTQAETLKQLSETELEIRNLLIAHGAIMKTMERGSEKEMIFRSVNDDVFNYLNFNVVLLSMKDVESDEAISKFTDEYIIPLMRRVNSSINRLSVISKTYIDESKYKMDYYQSYSKSFSVVAFILIGFSILVSVFYSYKV